jgi:hypothetical protein
LSVAAIDGGLVVRVLEPIWQAKPETAGRVRGRTEAILDYAKSVGFRTGENPAAWKGNLAHAPPARARVRKVEHHASLPYRGAAGVHGRSAGATRARRPLSRIRDLDCLPDRRGDRRDLG